eukprot:CAMPEP_0181214650 /NCGR_PEP_ID=MMETSP1096-20121128/25575_1 /TAXON_ID=156174 ORGANISM="Chrysochromulina ericina, Strain CCMP281" /NCGR_SAMPLE_ID=MMETSP1096 /ASSEMBLY_ACC=CAM_ASM_000453 /LENGTH=249 /DNA_ID=CAMNT_0023306417 /DNA_START=202 /DNA_END=952 /DNA_ORIENTATION=+
MRSEKMDETWRVTLHRFLEAPTWTFDDFRKTLSDSLDETDNINAAQKAYLQFDKVVRGGDTKDNLEKMKTQLRHQIQLIDKLTPSEKRIPRLLTHEARVMLADELAITKAQVDEVIERYETHHAMHSWIKREHAAGRQLPESYDELMWMMTLRPTRAVSRLQKIQQGRMMPPDAKGANGFIDETASDRLLGLVDTVSRASPTGGSDLSRGAMGTAPHTVWTWEAGLDRFTLTEVVCSSFDRRVEVHARE